MFSAATDLVWDGSHGTQACCSCSGSGMGAHCPACLCLSPWTCPLCRPSLLSASQ